MQKKKGSNNWSKWIFRFAVSKELSKKGYEVFGFIRNKQSKIPK